MKKTLLTLFVFSITFSLPAAQSSITETDRARYNYYFLQAINNENAQAALTKAAHELDRGADVNCTDANGRTALWFAAERGRENLVAMLIKAGARVNAIDKEGMGPLHKAVEHGYAHIVQQLIDAGALVDLPNNLGETPLLTAAASNCTHIAAILLANKANPLITNHSGISPLEYAICTNNGELIHNLKRMAQVDLNALLSLQETPLALAVRKNKPIALQALIQEGATVTDSLLLASIQNDMYDDGECVNTLLSAGISPNAKDTGGHTALCSAAAYGRTRCCQALFTKGASLLVKSPFEGEMLTPAEIARKRGHTALAEEIERTISTSSALCSLLQATSISQSATSTPKL